MAKNKRVGWCVGLLVVVGVAVLGAGLGVGCTKQNPNVCCTSALDCEAIGIPANSSCASGLACTNHECIEATCVVDPDCTDPAAAYCGNGLCRECTAAGQCPASAAVCNLTTNGCERCSADADCSSFAATPHCAANGACAECVTDLDCGATEPVCGTDGSCRTCEHDTECASGACDANGTCVTASAVIYISPTGIDAGGCVQALPCLTPGFAVSIVTPARFHIAMAPGSYTGQLLGSAAAPRIAVHGNGATITYTAAVSSPVINVNANKVFVRDLTIAVTGQAFGLDCKNNGEVDLRAVNVAAQGFDFNGASANACKVAWQDSRARPISISTNSQLTLRRMRFIDSQAVASSDSAVTLENVSVLRSNDYPFNFTRTQGSAAFVTVADSAPGHGGFNCTMSPIQITNSIIWVPNVGNTGDRPILGSCVAMGQNLIGPLTPATPTSVDPLFVDMANGDLHLLPTSLGVDKADTGPATDALGAARPLGAKFDLGAFESH